MKVWKVKDIHYNHQILCILVKKGQLPQELLPNAHAYMKLFIFVTRGALYLKYFYWHKYIFLKLSHSIWLYRSYGWFLHGDWHFNYPRCIYQVLKFPNQLPNSVTVEFTLFWGYLQLDHPVTCENIKCYSCTYSNNYLNEKL